MGNGQAFPIRIEVSQIAAPKSARGKPPCLHQRQKPELRTPDTST
jgi:hypothetical protein